MPFIRRDPGEICIDHGQIRLQEARAGIVADSGRPPRRRAGPEHARGVSVLAEEAEESIDRETGRAGQNQPGAGVVEGSGQGHDRRRSGRRRICAAVATIARGAASRDRETGLRAA
jgi:hypothetical protein